MATKLSNTVIKRLSALKVKAVTEEQAKQKLNDILVKEGIEGMEDEDIDTLIEMAESFVEDAEEATEEEAENDDLAEEVAEDEEEAEEEAEEEVPAAKPAKKAATPAPAPAKKATAPAPIPAKKAAPAPVAKAAATAKPAAAVPVKTRGSKLDPKNNEADRKPFNALKKIFPDKDYLYAWVASAGVTIKFKGKNSNRSMVLVENCSLKEDKSITCNLYLLTFTKSTEVLKEKDIDFEICWSGAPMIKGITMDEAIEIIESVMDEIVGSVSQIDKKLGENRAKMEENLSKDAKKPVAKKAVAKVEVEEEDEEEVEVEEEDEETPAPPVKKAAAKPAPAPVPAKKAVPVAPAKKTTKK